MPLFAYNLMIGYSNKKRENYLRECFWKKIKKPRLKFNPGLALTGIRTTGLWLSNLLLLTATMIVKYI